MDEKVNDNVIADENLLSFLKDSIAIPDETEIIYQYTNIDALFDGIVVKEPEENKEICLWASSYMYLNDPSEIATGQKYFNEILSQHFIEQNNDTDIVDSINDMEFFITSFSTTIDSLPMWSMYGKNGSGIALGFDRNIIHKGKGSDDALYKCVYLDDDLKNEITFLCESYKKENTIEEGEKIADEALILLFIIVLFALILNKDEKFIKEQLEDYIIPFLLFIIFAKDPAYKYENEVRLLVHSDKDLAVQYRSKNNLIIPYIENFFPKEALKEIWIGPTNDMKRTRKSLETYLSHMGFSDVKIHESSVPYR